MRFEFQRADGVRDVFQAVRHAMREVIQRVDAPGITRAVMMCMSNAVGQWVA